MARLGAEGSGRAASDAQVTRSEDGVVTATASTLADMLHIGPIVLAGVTSNASVVRRPGGEPERTSSLQAATFTIAGQGVVITPGGIVLGGTDIPAGEAPGLKEALAGANVTIETIKAQETPDGIVAPGLRISTTQDLPGAGVPGTVTYTLGQARASATVGASSAAVVSTPAPAEPASSASTPPVAAPSSETPGLTEAPAAIPEPATASVPLTFPGPSSQSAFSAYGQSGLPSPATEGVTDAPATAPAPAPSPAPASAPRAEQAELAMASLGSASSVSPFMWFPALVIAGVIVGLALHGQRLMRVRKSWSS